MLHFDEIVFGPIKSRRLGNSLGMNILPSKGKLCNFDCIYCECGWNKDGIVKGRRFPTYAEVREALDAKFEFIARQGLAVDSITMSGNGEPTLNPDFPAIVDYTLKMRDQYFPEAKVSVLSNATMLENENIVNALKKIDNPILKIDASSDELIRKINKPSGKYSLDTVIDGMLKFEGNFILQTMFLKSPDFSTVNYDALQNWYKIVRCVKPREIMVYTIDRETPDKSLQKYTVDEMESFVQPLIDEGFIIQVRG